MKLSSGTNHSPKASLLRKQHFPFSSLALCFPWGKGESGLPLAPWALLVCWWSPELETHSKRVLLRGEAGFEMERPCVQRPQQSTLSQTWRSTPRSHLTDDTKPGHDSCILESETNFKEQTTNPMRLCSGKQRLPFCPLSLCSQ